eukprot:TRINITY_DN95504_c0_g1_i1.p1 TRINITY_DN95504_c0_g1~~TRINITY_DN95504_c0_g1_i1.p1  ORF type:complete len:205 (-),score=47.48 TRINITY_DN95504_c0_g1_i1:59-673(-)
MSSDDSDDAGEKCSDAESPTEQPESTYPALAAAFLLPSTRLRKGDSEYFGQECESKLVGLAEDELLGEPELKEKQEFATRQEDAHSPSYAEEWFDRFAKDREVFLDDEHLLGMEDADEASDEEDWQALQLQRQQQIFWPWEATDSTSSENDDEEVEESVLCDEDGDVADEFWVENPKNGKMECARKRPPSPWPSATSGSKRTRQ